MRSTITLIMFPLFITACGVMQPVVDTEVNHLLDATVPERAITGTSPAIAIVRPALPSYLDRQQLVSRRSGGQLEMNSYHLWAEPLDAGISRVTAINLGRLENSNLIQPVESFVTLDYQWLLEIRVSRFEPDASGQLVLECTWKLQPVSGRVTNTRTFRTAVTIESHDPPAGPQTARIRAMNEALASLAREIASAIPSS